MWFLTNLKVVDCCQTPTNEKLIYFPTNSCKLPKHLSSSKIRSLKAALLGKIPALVQDVLVYTVVIQVKMNCIGAHQTVLVLIGFDKYSSFSNQYIS